MSIVDPMHIECFSSPTLKLFSGEVDGAVTRRGRESALFGRATRKSSRNSAEPFMIGQAFFRYSRSPPKAKCSQRCRHIHGPAMGKSPQPIPSPGEVKPHGL